MSHTPRVILTPPPSLVAVGAGQGPAGIPGSDANVTNASVNVAIAEDPTASKTALDLHEVAATGEYSALENLPTIPAELVDLDTDVTGAALNAMATKLALMLISGEINLDDLATRVNFLDSAVILIGEWDASAGTFPGGGTAQRGHSYQATVAGTVDGREVNVGDRMIAIVDNASTTVYAANWLHEDYTDRVSSVAGLVGVITAAALRAAQGLGTGDSPTFAGMEITAPISGMGPADNSFLSQRGTVILRTAYDGTYLYSVLPLLAGGGISLGTLDQKFIRGGERLVHLTDGDSGFADLKLRDLIAAQSIQVVNTYTDASNYERGIFGWSGNVLQIGTQAEGNGNLRDINIRTGGYVSFLNAGEATTNIRVGRIDFSTANSASPTLRISGHEDKFLLGSAIQFIWGNGTSFNSTADIGLARNSAGVLEINNGTLGEFRDLALRDLIVTPGGYIRTGDPATISYFGQFGSDRVGVGHGYNVTAALQVSAGDASDYLPTLLLASTTGVMWASGPTALNVVDLQLRRGGPNSLQLGKNHATVPTAQTIKAHDVTAGTGADLILKGGTGSVANGKVEVVGVLEITSAVNRTGGGDNSFLSQNATVILRTAFSGTTLYTALPFAAGGGVSLGDSLDQRFVRGGANLVHLTDGGAGFADLKLRDLIAEKLRSAGALVLEAGGSNQNVVVDPSGNGTFQVKGSGDGLNAFILQEFIGGNGVRRGYIYFEAGSGKLAIVNELSAPLVFGAGGADRFTVYPNGGVVFGVNTHVDPGASIVHFQGDVLLGRFLRPAIYTVAEAEALTSEPTGAVLTISDDGGGQCLAQFDGTVWRRDSDKLPISTTNPAVGCVRVVTVTDDYTLALVDKNSRVAVDVGTAKAWTIPLNSSVAFPIGTQIAGVQLGAGAVTIGGAVGVTVVSKGNLFTSDGPGAQWALEKIGENTWLLAGQLIA